MRRNQGFGDIQLIPETASSSSVTSSAYSGSGSMTDQANSQILAGFLLRMCD